MWEHIAEDFKKGKISSDFTEEIDRETRISWDKPPAMEPLQFMEKIVASCTDYEFLRRYLTEEMIDKFHLNRIDKRMAKQIGVTADDVMREDRRFIWLRTDDIKEQMLGFFTHFHRPRVYLIDCNFLDGGLLLYHRNDGRDLRKNWIRPTLKNINHIWHGTVSLLTKDSLCTWANGSYTEIKAAAPDFDTIRERILNGEKPFKADR